VRRGFKSEAERIALAVRSERELPLTEAFDPFAYASDLGIPVLSLSDLEERGADTRSVFYLRRVESSVFSAATVFDGLFRLIIYNDAHAPTRILSSVTHEIAHGALAHTPTPVSNELGQRLWDPEQEEEADWLAAALLVPRDGLLLLLARGRRSEDIARAYGVSPALLRWRTNQTGVMHQLARRRAWVRRPATDVARG
jgi:Zn-dependent peptidase ImmA (M78 family)